MDQFFSKDKEMRESHLSEVLNMMCWASHTIVRIEAYRDEIGMNSWIQVELKKTSKKALKLIHLLAVFVQQEPEVSDEGFENCFNDVKKKYNKQKKKAEFWEEAANKMIKEGNRDVF